MLAYAFLRGKLLDSLEHPQSYRSHALWNNTRKIAKRFSPDVFDEEGFNIWAGYDPKYAKAA